MTETNEPAYTSGCSIIIISEYYCPN